MSDILAELISVAGCTGQYRKVLPAGRGHRAAGAGRWLVTAGCGAFGGSRCVRGLAGRLSAGRVVHGLVGAAGSEVADDDAEHAKALLAQALKPGRASVMTPDDLVIGDSLSEQAQHRVLHGVEVPKGGTVLLCTGHHERTFPRKEYATDNSGVNIAATEWLAGQGIVHFGIDSMRPGPMGDVNLLVHKACLDLDITHIESLCNLEALLGQGRFTFIGLPMKWRDGTASPIRAVAVYDI